MSLVRPLTLGLDKDKKGWVLRSYDNNEYFDEKSVPHSIRAAPAARELTLKYESRCDCLLCLLILCLMLSADLGCDAKWLLLWSVLLLGNVRSLDFVTTAHMSRISQKYKQTSGCQNGVTYIHKNCILSGFIAMFLFSARSVKLWWQLESKCQAWLTTTYMGLWLVSSALNWPLIGWPTSRTLTNFY